MASVASLPIVIVGGADRNHRSAGQPASRSRIEGFGDGIGPQDLSSGDCCPYCGLRTTEAGGP
jgi:hypothetical protein